MNTLTFNSDIGVLIAKLMQELQSDVDPTKNGRIVVCHIFKLMLAPQLEVRQPERLLESPHCLSDDDRGRYFEHAGGNVWSCLVTASAKKIEDGGDLIARQGESRQPEWNIRREQRRSLSGANGRRG